MRRSLVAVLPGWITAPLVHGDERERIRPANRGYEATPTRERRDFAVGGVPRIHVC
ncbi:MAG: hypothetical protein QOE85_483 [Actinomycetota bacterium]|nr:hypothetical protein [Actinomycetota bacterium]